jgi:hypothetical protein
MDQPRENARFDRLIAPPALFGGLALAFAACCLGGYVSTTRNHFKHFERFHEYLSPESLYYPTAGQVRRLAQSRLDPEKIAVIVGGTSVLHGACQTTSQVWTRKLQALLGGRYQVLNLALRGGRFAEFGATVAEMLARDHPRLLLLADLPPCSVSPDPDGWHFKYFFWDAYCRGWLLPHEERERRLREQAEDDTPAAPTLGPTGPAVAGTLGDQQAELRDQMRLNRALYFNDFWSTLAYTTFCTVWTPATRASFTRARRHYADSEAGSLPLEARYRYDRPVRTRQIRGILATADSPEASWAQFDRAAREAFPEPVRRRTLLLVLWYSPYYLRELPAPQQACFARISRQTVEHLERLGFPALEAGQGYLVSDYGDGVHLTEVGGAKLAAAVAPRVRELARRLGYTP